MRVLITGAMGHIGLYTIHELLAQGHQVRTLDLPTPANQKKAAQFGGRIETCWLDLSQATDITPTLAEQDAVVHLAFVLPPKSEQNPQWAETVNVGGSRLLIAAMKKQTTPPRLLFASSFSVHGDTLHNDTLLTPDSPLSPLNHYNQHKITVEEMVRSSGLKWCILRLGAALSLDLNRGFDATIFDLPPTAKQEFVHPADVALAIANCLKSEAVWGKVWMIGGGQRCRLYYLEMINRMLAAAGIGPLPARAFSPIARQGGGWMDTSDSQRLLNYQRHTFEEYLAEFGQRVGWRRHLLHLLNPLICWYMLRLSPHYNT